MLYIFEEEGKDTMEKINGVGVIDKEELVEELGSVGFALDCRKSLMGFESICSVGYRA